MRDVTVLRTYRYRRHNKRLSAVRYSIAAGAVLLLPSNGTDINLAAAIMCRAVQHTYSIATGAELLLPSSDRDINLAAALVCRAVQHSTAGAALLLPSSGSDVNFATALVCHAVQHSNRRCTSTVI